MNDEIAEQIESIRRAWNSVDIGKENLSRGLSELFKSVTEKYPQQISLEMAIERIRWELLKAQERGSYYHTWHYNLVMCFYDAYKHRHPMHAEHTNAMGVIHEIANNAATTFLNILCQQTGSSIGLTKQEELQKSQSIPPQP